MYAIYPAQPGHSSISPSSSKIPMVKAAFRFELGEDPPTRSNGKFRRRDTAINYSALNDLIKFRLIETHDGVSDSTKL